MIVRFADKAGAVSRSMPPPAAAPSPSAQPGRAADVDIVVFEEPKLTVDFAGDADAYAFADGPCASDRGPKPQCTLEAEVGAVEAAVDVHRHSEAARTTREIGQLCPSSIGPHHFHPLDGLEGTNEHARPDAMRLRAYVDCMPASVDEIDVGNAAIQEKRSGARGNAAKSVACRIADDVGLRLDDPAGHAAAAVVANQRFADEVARQPCRVDRKLRPAQHSVRNRHRLKGRRWD